MKKIITLFITIFTFTFVQAQTSINDASISQSTRDAMWDTHLQTLIKQGVNPNDLQHLQDITSATQGKPLVAATLNGSSMNYAPYQLSPGEVVYGTPQGVPVKTSKGFLVGSGSGNQNNGVQNSQQTPQGQNTTQVNGQQGMQMGQETMNLMLQKDILDKQIQLAQLQQQNSINGVASAYQTVDKVNAMQTQLQQNILDRKYGAVYNGGPGNPNSTNNFSFAYTYSPQTGGQYVKVQ